MCVLRSGRKEKRDGFSRMNRKKETRFEDLMSGSDTMRRRVERVRSEIGFSGEVGLWVVEEEQMRRLWKSLVKE